MLHLSPARALTVPAMAAPKRPRLLLALGLGLSMALATGPAHQALAFGAPDSFADLAQQISPSVVNITTSSVVAQATDGGPMVPPGSPFEDFFKDFMDQNGQGNNEPQRSEALGSGFVISADGYIVTNNHVIEGADEIIIEFFGGEKMPAKLIGTDPKTDIAVLKVEAKKPLPFVSFGGSGLVVFYSMIGLLVAITRGVPEPVIEDLTMKYRPIPAFKQSALHGREEAGT